MKLELRNDDGEVLDLATPLKWMANEPPLTRRVGLQQRFGKPGGFITGDRRAGTRRITLQSDITGENDPAYLLQLADIVKIFEPRVAPYFLVDTDNDRRAEVELDSITPQAVRGTERRHSPIQLTLIMVETYWEDLIEKEDESGTGGIVTGETFNIDNEGEVDLFPIFEITPTANNSAFSIFNNTTNDIITVGSTAFVPGTTLIIDSQEGSVVLDNGSTQIEISSAIGRGTGFLFLAPGVNTLQYESAFGAVNITTKFRQRFAF